MPTNKDAKRNQEERAGTYHLGVYLRLCIFKFSDSYFNPGSAHFGGWNVAVTEACRLKAQYLQSGETLKANANELTSNHAANSLLCLSTGGCVWLRPQEALVLLYDPSPS